jgi:mercuric ion transport protein
VAVALGVSGAGLAATFEPLRPYLAAAAGALLALGFYLLGREERKACEPGRACAEPSVRRQMRRTLWVATGLAVLLAAYPVWSAWIL